MSFVSKSFASMLLVTALGFPAVAEDTPLSEAPERIDHNSVTLGFESAEEEHVTALVDQLGHWDFEQREAAAAELERLGPRAFRYMARAFRRRDDYEVRVRIEEIVRESFLWHTLLKHKGFLGIGYQPFADPRLPDGGTGVLVTLVQPDSAASRGGLRIDDLIVAVDGDPISAVPGSDDFRNRIQNMGAGGRVTLEVLRRNVRVSLPIVLEARPITQYTDAALIDELNHYLQIFSQWWATHFSLPERTRERMPSSVVLDIPE